MNPLSILARLAMFVVFALPCAATGVTPANPEPKQTNGAISQLLADGNAAFEAGDIAKAAACWGKVRECATATPDWPKAVFNLGLLEYKRSNFRQAIAYFSEVLQAQPNDREPGGNLMQTNRNYTNRCALAISECYEAMGAYGSALHYARLAKTKYPYYSWCGTCYNNANFALNTRIMYLTVRASRVHLWGSMLVLGFFAFRWKKVRKLQEVTKNTSGVGC